MVWFFLLKDTNNAQEFEQLEENATNQIFDAGQTPKGINVNGVIISL